MNKNNNNKKVKRQKSEITWTSQRLTKIVRSFTGSTSPTERHTKKRQRRAAANTIRNLSDDMIVHLVRAYLIHYTPKLMLHNLTRDSAAGETDELIRSILCESHKHLGLSKPVFNRAYMSQLDNQMCRVIEAVSSANCYVSPQPGLFKTLPKDIFQYLLGWLRVKKHSKSIRIVNHMFYTLTACNNGMYHEFALNSRVVSRFSSGLLDIRDCLSNVDELRSVCVCVCAMCYCTW